MFRAARPARQRAPDARAARRLRSGLKVSNRCSTSNGRRLCAPSWAGSPGNRASRDTEVLQARIDHHADEVGEDFAPLIRAVVDPALSERWHDARDHALKRDGLPEVPEFLDNLVDAARVRA